MADRHQDLKKAFVLISEIAVLLMQSGANTKRVIDNINRFAATLGFKSFALISHKSIMSVLRKVHNSKAQKK